MTTATIKLRKADVASLVKATFPNYSGRTFTAEQAERVTFHDLNWGGGTRNQYVVVDMVGGRVADLRPLSRVHPAQQPMEGQVIELPAGVVVVEHSTFCGKDCGLRFYFNPNGGGLLQQLSAVVRPAQMPRLA